MSDQHEYQKLSMEECLRQARRVELGPDMFKPNKEFGDMWRKAFGTPKSQNDPHGVFVEPPTPPP